MITLLPYSEDGKTSNAYLVVDKKVRMIAKLPKEKLTSEGYKEYAYNRELQSAYAFQLTRMYRKSVIDIDQYLPIFYVAPVVYELEDEFLGSRFLYAEPEINVESVE
jgi:hypothetical protein